jgi:S-formylglutathione hydrolase FrmB
VYFWLYSGTDDPLHSQNQAFAARLRSLGIPHAFFLSRGGHNWALWRNEAARALVVASRRLGRG